MKIYRLIAIILLLTNGVSCKTHYGSKLQPNLIELSHFSELEINEIENLISAFDSAVSMNGNHNDDFNSDYQEYFNSTDDSNFDEIIKDLSQPQNMLRFRSAINGLKSQNSFDDFWIIRSKYSPFDSDSTFELKINPLGRYFETLKKLGDQDQVIKDYSKNLLISGEISPGMIAQLLKLQLQEINFSNNSYRLIWTVHYITVLTQVNENAFKELNPE